MTINKKRGFNGQQEECSLKSRMKLLIFWFLGYLGDDAKALLIAFAVYIAIDKLVEEFDDTC